MIGRKRILFVCVENAGRSQMAEGFFKKFAPAGYEVMSAGTRPVTEINPLAVSVMNEVGIDISKQKPKILSDKMIEGSYKFVNMGCLDNESCPSLFLKNALNWNIEDPKGKPLDEVRKIRDTIETRVKEFVASI